MASRQQRAVREVVSSDDNVTEADDDLDNSKSGAKDIDLMASFDSDDDRRGSASNSSGKKRKHEPQTGGERIAFSDNEEPEAEYDASKKRKTEIRKKAAAQTRRAKKEASTSTIVGRKPKTAIRLRERHINKDNHGSDSDSDDESYAPQFIKKRRADLAGYHLPPDYDGIHFSDEERLETLEEKPVLHHIKPVAPYRDIDLRQIAGGIIPAPIAQWLREYQVQGARFLLQHYAEQKGCILGDDMGLGKTIQVIAFLTAAFGKTGDARDDKRMRKMRRAGKDYPKVLIVCPGGLMENWRSELWTWGWWQTEIFHGGGAIRDSVLAMAKQGMLEIMITTYTTYRNHKDSVNLVQWDCVIADEFHIIKESKAEITKAMNEVNALCRIGLSGTAIQNKYDELWNLLNWTNPGILGPLRSWRLKISEPLKAGQSHDATVAQLALARRTAKRLRDNLLPQFFLRRMKSLIADQLPKKSDKVVFCPLTDMQAQAYENLVECDIIQAIRNASDPCHCGSGKKQGSCCEAEIEGHGKWQALVFPMLTTLQKLSNHLAMLVPSSLENDKDKQERELEYLQIAVPNKWKDLYRDRDNIVSFATQEYCGKWKVLKQLLHFWHGNGDKVLVFSHSVRLLKMLSMLFRSTTSYNVSYLDGSMNLQDRAAAVDSFNSDPSQFVFLISTRAGGVGLNITSANKVVVFDPNWNPSYDLQAQDRAYRIGQTRDVEVFRLVSTGTVEEVVYARQIYKQQQANIAYNASIERRYFKGVQDVAEKKGEIFGLANIFSFQGDNVVLRDIVNKTNIAESRAGVSIVGLDASQEQTEDSDIEDQKQDRAISRLAALLTDADDAKARSDGRKADAVAAILAGAGVEYTHENSEVIGSSKIETRLSRRAERAGNDIAAGLGQVFQKSQETGARDGGLDSDLDDVEGGGGGAVDGIRYKYRPSEAVRKRQFVSMSRAFGYQDAVDFALVVEGWTQERRRDWLEGFYEARRRDLG
ncbi:hypothetical protein MBLNU457_3102t1 [Dothideomycetes sp. NU457]